MKKVVSAITETSSEIILKNRFLQVNISKENGNVVEITNLMTGKSILAPSENPAFVTLNLSVEETVSPASASVENGRIKFTFKDLCDVYLVAENCDNYIALTLDSELPEAVYSIAFGVLTAEYEWDLDNENAFGLSGIAMTTTIDPTYFPGGSFKATKANIITSIGVPLKGSKFGIAFSRMTEHRDHLKSIVDDIDPAKGITSKHGGPYALDHKDPYGDYVILSWGLTPETAVETAKLAKEYSVEQIDMHQGFGNFLQADFNFVGAATEEEKANGTFIPPEVFKERIADKITAEGVQLGLHTYSSLVPKYAKTIVTVPKWQKQISYDPNTHTVKGDLSADATDIFTHEDTSNVVINRDDMPYRVDSRTQYFLIDEEIVRIQKVTADGFIEVERGQLETKAAPHKDGAEIRQLRGWFSMFQPIPLSELFYHLASLTANAYNKGGYEMIYLDGLESFGGKDLYPRDKIYFPFAEFVRAVISQCDTYPLIEYSSFFPCLWNARARGGAIDHARRGYKDFKNMHLERQEKFHKYFYTATVGWFNYAPDMYQTYKNTLFDTMFRDDLDHMGSLALANGFGTVCQPFSVMEFNAGSMLADNFAYYNVYSRLREADYFAPEVKNEILARKHEHKVFKQKDGSWAFKEMEYFKHRIHMLGEDCFTTGKATNPFGVQTPFVRIEQAYSSVGGNSSIVKEFDETKPVTDLVGTYEIPETNYDENFAFRMRVHGNGSDSDAIVITLSAAHQPGNEFNVPVNFKGWKEITLIEPTNWGRCPCMWKNIGFVDVQTVGDCKGVMIGDLKSVKIENAPVDNPSVTVNGKTLTFNTELNSGEYVEYYPEFNKAYHTYYTPTPDENGIKRPDKAHVEEIGFTGMVEVPTGNFSYTYSAQPKTDAPTRAKAVIGVSGAVIKNPDSWKVPEVDIAEGLERIKLK
ncbi:MAG: hypothetical protein IKL05_05290 [Clostridia bacterium]|nr:hypothetical protein [Clostridia bacterium]